jgi:hypothetical protein
MADGLGTRLNIHFRSDKTTTTMSNSSNTKRDVWSERESLELMKCVGHYPILGTRQRPPGLQYKEFNRRETVAWVADMNKK